MVKVKVRTIWKGLVAIRDKYIKQAYEEKVGIQISHGKESIFIPYEEIESKIVTESDKISDNCLVSLPLTLDPLIIPSTPKSIISFKLSLSNFSLIMLIAFLVKLLEQIWMLDIIIQDQMTGLLI